MGDVKSMKRLHCGTALVLLMFNILIVVFEFAQWWWVQASETEK